MSPVPDSRGGKNTYRAPEFWPEQQANSMPNKQTRSGQSAVPFEMSTRNRSYHNLRTPQSADEQLDLTEHSESFEPETTSNPQDDNEEHVLDPQTTNDLIQRLQDQINRLQGRLTTPQPPPARTSQSDRVEREQERIQKLAKGRFADRQPVRLKGCEKYTTWRDNLLLKAQWIKAKSILVNVEISPPSYEPIEVARWQKQNKILHSRTLLSLDERI
jgi:TolA-binding protein